MVVVVVLVVEVVVNVNVRLVIWARWPLQAKSRGSRGSFIHMLELNFLLYSFIPNESRKRLSSGSRRDPLSP